MHAAVCWQSLVVFPNFSCGKRREAKSFCFSNAEEKTHLPQLADQHDKRASCCKLTDRFLALLPGKLLLFVIVTAVVLFSVCLMSSSWLMFQLCMLVYLVDFSVVFFLCVCVCGLLFLFFLFVGWTPWWMFWLLVLFLFFSVCLASSCWMTEGCICWCWFCMYPIWHHLAEWQKVVFVGADFVCILSGIILLNDRRLYLLVLILYVSCLASSCWMTEGCICWCWFCMYLVWHHLDECFGYWCWFVFVAILADVLVVLSTCMASSSCWWGLFSPR